jgi:tyrosyl-tRNA synthetase
MAHDNLFEEFQWRGMLHEATPDLREVLGKEKLTAYIGFDPSAPVCMSDHSCR